mmetsp:Transcript_55741/g.110737  ORF Transcript_55741/g.110737 Transcript_55741/m.110737 type:complete len:211 (-) Transcript_55741:202-834(-)
MASPKLKFFTCSPRFTSSGATCAAENRMRPSLCDKLGSFTGSNGFRSKSNESRHTNGPKRFLELSPKVLTRIPAIFMPQSFRKGAVVSHLPRPKESEIPTLNRSSINTGIAESSRKCGTRVSASGPERCARILTRTVPAPCSSSTLPERIDNVPTGQRFLWPTKTRPGLASRIEMLYGFGFMHDTSMRRPKRMLCTPSSKSSMVAMISPH